MGTMPVVAVKPDGQFGGAAGRMCRRLGHLDEALCLSFLDQAGWHLSGGLKIASNITLIPLPAKCPELNPQENIWQFIRDNWLSNRIFKSYDDIVDRCCRAWNMLVDQPWRIMSIGMRDWAPRF